MELTDVRNGLDRLERAVAGLASTVGSSEADTGGAASKLHAVTAADELAPDAVLVLPRISDDQKRLFETEGAGWIEGGRFRLRIDGSLYTAQPDRGSRRVERSVRTLSGPVVSAVTVDALIRWPEPATGVRELARREVASPGGVSLASHRLIEAGLLTADRRATRALFWAAAREWRPHWVEVPAGFAPGTAVAVGTGVATSMGAPALAANDRSEVLVATEADIQLASLRPRQPETELVLAAVAPSPAAMRFSEEGGSTGEIPTAAEAVVALSLATDSGRGSEIVEGWSGDHVWN